MPVKAQYETTTACEGTYFEETLCDTNEGVILVLEAVYAVSFCVNLGTECCPNTVDCSIVISFNNPDYFEEIEEACNGKAACTNLLARRTTSLAQCSESFTDYVRIYYRCIQSKN